MSTTTFTIQKQEATGELYRYAADQLTIFGKLPLRVKYELEKLGLSKEEADKLVEKVYAEVGHELTIKQKAQRDILVGALWCIGGIAVTTFSAASSSGGGRYLVAVGGIVFGGIQFIKGLVHYFRN